MSAATSTLDARGLRLAIGTAALAVPYGPPGAERPPPERSAARRTLEYALERGLRLIDTAPAYGEAEALVGAALGGREDRGDCVVATKLAIPPRGWTALSSRETRAHVRASVHASLRALGRERLDVLQIHNAEPAQVRAGALMEALAELRAQGLVGLLGATVYGEAAALAALAAVDLEVVQIAYSALDRRAEHGVLPAAVAAGKRVVARSLLLHGVLSPSGRDLGGPFAPLGVATDAVRQALGVSWEELPGAAVAFVASRPGIACALLGPREEAELAALLDQAERFQGVAAGWQPAAPELPDWLLDPSRWPRGVERPPLVPGCPKAPGGGPRAQSAQPSGGPAQALRLLCLFHLNLAFSSLEEESHAEIIRRCYRPALQLARDTGFPIAVEATGWTLRRIAQLAPDWIELLRELLAEGSAEFVGSAHAQCAAPLLPALLNAWNLRLGREAYEELLGVAPRIALVCEQVYSPGLVPLYLDAGYEALIVDWDNARRSHPRWPAEHRLHPQRALGGGRAIPIVWSKSIAFQKFQRFAHGELSLERYLDYVRGVGAEADRATGAVRTEGRALMLYANDVEIFDHRPGRFAAEPDLRQGEWSHIATGLRALRDERVGVPALPSELLDLLDVPGAGHRLRLEGPAQPIPVKKQDKYNVSRWAVTGRDDIGINTRCWRLYGRLREEGATDPERWRELCELWASDFRTHITDARWSAFCARLESAERRWLPAPSRGSRPLCAGAEAAGEDRGLLELRAGPIAVALNTRRGMAIEAFSDARISDRPLLGTLEHGYFPTIELGADFYSGHLVQESPLTHKLTDLERVRPTVGVDRSGRMCARARIATALGPIEKAVRLDRGSGGMEIEWVLHWSELPLGSLRLGYVTLLPEAFEARTLWYATHNGGSELETQRVGAQGFDHGAAVSALVTCRQGLGVTEGVVLLGDAERAIRVEIDHTCALPLGLITWIPGAERWFLRLCFALTESDETRRGGILRAPEEPQRMRMRVSAETTPTGIGKMSA